MGLEGLQAHKPLMSVLCGKANKQGIMEACCYKKKKIMEACAMPLPMKKTRQS
jgi:hypothetical protein